MGDVLCAHGQHLQLGLDELIAGLFGLGHVQLLEHRRLIRLPQRFVHVSALPAVVDDQEAGGHATRYQRAQPLVQPFRDRKPSCQNLNACAALFPKSDESE